MSDASLNFINMCVRRFDNGDYSLGFLRKNLSTEDYNAVVRAIEWKSIMG